MQKEIADMRDKIYPGAEPMSDSGHERPNCKHGNDSQCPHCAEIATLRTQLAAAEARAERMEGALRDMLQSFGHDHWESVTDNARVEYARATVADAPQAMRSGGGDEKALS